MDGKLPARTNRLIEPGGSSAANRTRAVGEVAGRQHGKVAREQLRQIGLSDDAIDGELRRGRLTADHQGVYSVGHAAPTNEGRAIAAVLACGSNAFLSHHSAAYLLNLLPYPANFAQAGEIDVSVAARCPPKRPGIRVHEAALLDRRDIRVHDDIPTTSPARTLLDLAASANESEFERAFDEAIFSRRLRGPQLLDVLERSSGRRGVRRLRQLWAAESAGERNRLEAEKRFGTLIKEARLPAPLANAAVDRFVVDFLWPQHRVVGEIDGFATHGRRMSFEGDRARDGDLQALNLSIIRVTWRQLTREPLVVVARVAARLALSGSNLKLTADQR